MKYIVFAIALIAILAVASGFRAQSTFTSRQGGSSSGNNCNIVGDPRIAHCDSILFYETHPEFTSWDQDPWKDPIALQSCAVFADDWGCDCCPGPCLQFC